MTITGHETPLIIGLPRNIICTWSGEINVTKIEWILAGVDDFTAHSATNTNTLELFPDDSGLDGAIFLCKVTTTNGNQYEERITVKVKGHYCMATQ